MSRLRVVSAAASIAVGPAFVSRSGTEPPADSPLTGEWVSANSPWVRSLTLDLLEEDGGEISGSFTTTLGRWKLEGMVKGEYAHPEVRLTLTSGMLVYGGYTGKRVDHDTIDGDFEIGSFGDQVIARRLERQP